MRSFIEGVRVGQDQMVVRLRPGAFGIDAGGSWTWRIPLPPRKPFREAKLRIDALAEGNEPNRRLICLLAEARGVQKLVLASPELSMNQLAKREGRCRAQLAKLLRISWLSPRIVEAIFTGTQPAAINRRTLLRTDIPVDWDAQERLFSLAA